MKEVKVIIDNKETVYRIDDDDIKTLLKVIEAFSQVK